LKLPEFDIKVSKAVEPKRARLWFSNEINNEANNEINND
jgi:hypothetical protein